MRRACALVVALAGCAAAAEHPTWFEARLTTSMQLFQQGLLPGLPGTVTRIEPAFPFTAMAWARFGEASAPLGLRFWGELSAWGRLGSLQGRSVDGDLNAAWVELQRGVVRLRLGRQVALPGSSRYLRFDGATLGVGTGPAQFEVWGGWVALPRWSQPRGAVLAGFAGDALKAPELFAPTERLGQFAFGGRVQFAFPLGRVAVSAHEQRDALGVTYRVLAADADVQPARWLAVGARASYDLVSRAVPEAKVFVDLLPADLPPLSVDYSFQSPGLLLPKTSVLAAFAAASWHELGAESTVPFPKRLKVTLRGAGQLFEGDRLGGRGSLRGSWVPDEAGRARVLLEAGRALVPPSGFAWVRAAGAYRVAEGVDLTADTAAYWYDRPVRGVRHSLTAVLSAEWAPKPWLRVLGSGAVMSTPYAAVEAQAMARLSVELDGSRP